MTVRLGLHFTLASATRSDWAGIYAACLEQCEAAEGCGFFCALVVEHHFQEDGFIPSPLIVCAAIAARTRRLRIGTDVVPLPLQNPIKLAEDVAVHGLTVTPRAVRRPRPPILDRRGVEASVRRAALARLP